MYAQRVDRSGTRKVVIPSMANKIYCSPLRRGALELSRRWLTRRGVSHAPTHMGRQTKTMIVLEGLKGKPVAEICTEHQIGQSQYYQCRDQFLAHASKAFEVHHDRQKEAARSVRMPGSRSWLGSWSWS
jgi:transposase-like protein